MTLCFSGDYARGGPGNAFPPPSGGDFAANNGFVLIIHPSDGARRQRIAEMRLFCRGSPATCVTSLGTVSIFLCLSGHSIDWAGIFHVT